MWAALAMFGGECESEWNHIAQFVATFAPKSYDSGEDSELGELRSEGPASAPSATEPEDEDGKCDGIAWYDSKAEEEHKLIQKAHGEATTKDERSQLAEGLGKVLSEAGKAAEVVRQVAMEHGARMADIGAEERKVVGGEGESAPAASAVPRVLAIMDAVDQPVPNSGDSGCEALEPRQKRRGREVEVAGGCTGHDVQMEKGSGERGTEDGGGLGASGEVRGG